MLGQGVKPPLKELAKRKENMSENGDESENKSLLNFPDEFAAHFANFLCRSFRTNKTNGGAIQQPNPELFREVVVQTKLAYDNYPLWANLNEERDWR